MIAILFYVLHVIIGGFLWSAYNHLQQPISDLTASGAPNKESMLYLTYFYAFFVLIFAVSFIWLESKKHSKLVLWGGIFFLILHIISASYGFFPQDLPGSPVTSTGTMHIVITFMLVPFTILSPIFMGLGFKKENYWKSFGIYSIISGIGIFIFGGLCAIFFANKLPYFGLVERINIGFLQCWTFCLSYKSFINYGKN